MVHAARHRAARSFAGVSCCIALAGCANSTSGSATPKPAAIDTMTFAPVLDVDITKFTRTSAGSYYRDVVIGSGAAAALNRTLTLAYVISLVNGKVIEAQATPADVVLGESVIRGWRDALPGMRAGGTRVMVLPPEMAYGRAGYGDIPPRATLVFRVELIAVH
jgi:FKBP-type peptidyl-prolyl cis-trans isomerase FkpA